MRIKEGQLIWLKPFDNGREIIPAERVEACEDFDTLDRITGVYTEDGEERSYDHAATTIVRRLPENTSELDRHAEITVDQVDEYRTRLSDKSLN